MKAKSAYPAYRDSGLAHMPRLPSHWTTKRVKFIAKVGNGSTPSRDESAYWENGTYPWLNSSVVNQERVMASDQHVTPLAVRECHLPQIDPPAVLVGITGEGRTRGMATTLAFQATINQHIAYVKPIADEVDVDFLRRVFDSNYTYLRNESEGGGSTKGAITCQQISEMVVPFPPLNEQKHIAKFLDWKTAQIDSLIAKKQALFARIRERQAAEIHSGVCGADGELLTTRYTGGWLPPLPRHWDTPPLKYRYSVDLGKMLDSKRIDGTALKPYLRNVDVQWDDIRFDALPEMDIHVEELERYTVRAGDLLVCEGGEVGRAAIVPESLGGFGYQKALHRLRPLTDSEHPRYLYYTLRWAAQAGAFAGEGAATIAHLTAEQLREYRFPRPPIDEQRDISAELDRVIGHLMALAEAAQAVISRLTEYRSALITAAVTGQIDVRGVAVPVSLPG